MNIRDFFHVKISGDQLLATVVLKKPLPEEEEEREKVQWTKEDWLEFLERGRVTYGIIDEHLDRLVKDPYGTNTPLEIARGKQPIPGEDAYLSSPFKNGVEKEKAVEETANRVNLKQITDIPMVKEGEFAGEKIDPTPGIDGVAVTGERITARKGRDFPLRPGKNTRVEGNRIYATKGGQVSVQKRIIHVHPSYEVSGDLDMKTGNIDFTGSVIIRGNVPSGYEIKAEGDIHIFGMVEASLLEAGGSIHISGGVSSQKKGRIKANKDVHALYLNEAHVEAGGAIYIRQAIMHSVCEAGEEVLCKDSKGQIVGGKISAGRKIHAKEVGNAMHTSTALFIGASHDFLSDVRREEEILRRAKEETAKVRKLLRSFEQKEKKGFHLSTKEKVLQLRAKNTLNQWTKRAVEAAEKLQDMKDIYANQDRGIIIVENNIHPNVDIHFGKYRRKTNTTYTYVNIQFIDGEIAIQGATHE